MKKSIIVSLTSALLLFAESSFTLSHAQAPSPSDTPTFYRLVPGAYVNGWPRFTTRYPKDWVEEKPSAMEVFRVASPDPVSEEKLAVQVFPGPLALDKAADTFVAFFKNVAQEVTVVADHPSRLGDGTPTREVELRMVMNGVPIRFFRLAANKGNWWVATAL